MMPHSGPLSKGPARRRINDQISATIGQLTDPELLARHLLPHTTAATNVGRR
jgi:hypothetical protein